MLLELLTQSLDQGSHSQELLYLCCHRPKHIGKMAQNLLYQKPKQLVVPRGHLFNALLSPIFVFLFSSALNQLSRKPANFRINKSIGG